VIRIRNIKLPFDHQDRDLYQAAAIKLGLPAERIQSLEIQRRSLDARANRPLSRVYTVIVEVADQDAIARRVDRTQDLDFYQAKTYQLPELLFPGKRERPVVVGTGPAGTFAGLILAEAGLRPILIERGKPVRQRVRDVDQFWRQGKLDQESNVQFGEGGAGTFSDGKLTTRVKDKHLRAEKVLQELAAAGGPGEILYDKKPHLGTANLVRIMENLRFRIEGLGGEYRFQTRLEDLVLDGNRVSGLVLSGGEQLTASSVLLAIGHSARDTFAMLHQRGLQLAPKPFSVGFRIEHSQAWVDEIQYGKAAGHPALGAADYQLSYRTSLGRTVYSFCMCPGGSVIGAASEPESIVTNGMSQYARDGDNANSAIVAEVFPKDFAEDPLGGVQTQRAWERQAYTLGGGEYIAPAQRVEDFLRGKVTDQLQEVQPSYQPGVRLVDLNQAFPDYVTDAIREALHQFEKRMPGFTGPEAVFTGVETRTSCPLRILRGKDGQSVSIPGIYPAGEGSGYAGGIMSSAIDGIKAAEKILQRGAP